MSDKRTLLIVDDESDILDFLNRVFRKQYKILRAESASEALAICNDAAVNLLISDQRMPGMSGLELLGQVAKSRPDTTRVLLSGFSDLPEINLATDKGLVHAYVVKPVDSRSLREAVEEAQLRQEQGEWRSD